MEQDTGKILLIDGYSILNRAYYGMPDFTNSTGLHTGAILGFLNILLKTIEDEAPTHLAVAFDVHAPTFRHKMFDGYKATRKPMADELREQVPVLKEVLDAMGITRVEQEGLEADDILGTMAKRAQAKGMEALILSGDRDLLQVADERITIVLPRTKGGKTESDRYTPAKVKEDFGVTPAQFIELKALQGDSSDNIPGVPKVGEKTARELMETYGSIASVYEHLEEISKKSIRESLRENRALCDLSKDLATIRTDSDIAVDPASTKIGNTIYTPEALALFRKLEFRQLTARLEKQLAEGAPSEETDAREVSYALLETKEQAQALFAALTDSERVGYAFAAGEDKTGLAVCGDADTVYFLQVKHPGEEQLSLFATERQADQADEFTLDDLRAYMEGLDGKDTLLLSSFDVKNTFRFFTPQGVRDEAETGSAENAVRHLFDIRIAAYLLNPLKSDYAPEDIALEYLDWKTETPAKEDGADADMVRACNLALLSFLAEPVLRKRLEETGQKALFEEIEMPLTYVLYDMERLGIRAKREALREYGSKLAERIAELEQIIHTAAGEDFNINSPKQLGEILFEKMGLQGGKKTKTGYSTAADVLEKLAPDVPFVRDVLEYRGLAKLKSTYADALADFIGEDGRIHTVFHQCVTATGRLSSSDPNLQNIPMRTDLGREIRKVFVPEEGYVFADADYSQIELRILAHMSDDEALIEAYHTDKDIHAITASKVFHVPFDEVTPLMRRNAKAVNFGIVYGISAFGLAGDLSISREEAKRYMEQYFETYPGVKKYQAQAVADAKEHGCSVTLYGRRRPVPELKSSNFMQRSFGERVAMNAPIQGTAADIMKIAMLRVWNRLRREKLRAKMILQIHDELLIEAPLNEQERVLKLLEEEMRDAASLKVPLEVEAHSGADWYACK